MQDSSLADVADILDDYATIVGESDEPEALQQQQQVRALCAQLRGVTDGQAASSEPE